MVLNTIGLCAVRVRGIKLKYKLYKDDNVERNYLPDFYLPDSDEFIEIKGYYWKSEDGRIDDRLKMQRVIECNKDKKIKILMKAELLKLNLAL
jgi:hypothetical protein